jgi:hypothetical protein
VEVLRDDLGRRRAGGEVKYCSPLGSFPTYATSVFGTNL